MGKVVVVGAYMCDHTFDVEHLPRRGETYIAQAQISHGGKASNQALAAAAFGAEVVPVFCVGKDAAGQEIIDFYAKRNIDTSRIRQTEVEPTGTALILRLTSGDNSIVAYPAASLHVTAEDCPDELFQKNDFLAIQLEIPLDAVKAIIAKAKKAGTTVILDPAPWRDNPWGEKISLDFLSKADIVTPNEQEAKAMTGVTIQSHEDARKAAEILLKTGVGACLITLGGLGVYYLSHNQEHSLTCPKIKPVDTTGAGDIFNGVLAASLVQNLPVEKALSRAMMAASLSTQTKGAGPSIPTNRTLEKFIEEIGA